MPHRAPIPPYTTLTHHRKVNSYSMIQEMLHYRSINNTLWRTKCQKNNRCKKPELLSLKQRRFQVTFLYILLNLARFISFCLRIHLSSKRLILSLYISSIFHNLQSKVVFQDNLIMIRGVTTRFSYARILGSADKNHGQSHYQKRKTTW